MQKDKTTIQVSKDLIPLLNDIKIVPRESHDNVIRRLINETKSKNSKRNK